MAPRQLRISKEEASRMICGLFPWKGGDNARIEPKDFSYYLPFSKTKIRTVLGLLCNNGILYTEGQKFLLTRSGSYAMDYALGEIISRNSYMYSLIYSSISDFATYQWLFLRFIKPSFKSFPFGIREHYVLNYGSRIVGDLMEKLELSLVSDYSTIRRTVIRLSLDNRKKFVFPDKEKASESLLKKLEALNIIREYEMPELGNVLLINSEYVNNVFRKRKDQKNQ